MKISTVVVSMFETNCYLACDEFTGKCAIIDPGDEPEKIFSEIEQLNVTPEVVLLTHGHGDHIGAVVEMIHRYKIPLFAGDGEETLLSSPERNMSAAVGLPIICPPPKMYLKESDKVKVGNISFSVISTPGHSPGGVCYLHENILFCGDTLFYGSVGRTDFPGCSHEQLISSIANKLMNLPDSTKCYPGHGPATTIGYEKKHNPFLQGGGKYV
ncbi:MAG: MBL fold metallo-hydrolase [Candidatus Zixiibacteriota bacterium]